MKIKPIYDSDTALPTSYFEHYEGQSERQPVDLLLDVRDGTMWIEVDGNIGPRTPVEISYGQILRFALREVLTPAGANKLLDRVKPLAQDILSAGGEAEDTSLAALVIAEDRAIRRLRDYLDNGAGVVGWDVVGIWPEGGRCINTDWVEADFTADLTDEQVAAYAARLLSDLARDNGFGAAVCPGLVSWLVGYRNRLRAVREVIRQAEMLTPEQVARTAYLRVDVDLAAWDAAWDAAFDAAWEAWRAAERDAAADTWDAARAAVNAASMGSTWAVASGVASAAAAAAQAAVVADLVGQHGLTAEHLDTLGAPWRAITESLEAVGVD